MAKRHDDKAGEYPVNTLKSMIDGKLTLRGKKSTGYKNQPQSIPIHLIKYLPCIPAGQSGGTRKSIGGRRKKRTRKHTKKRR